MKESFVRTSLHLILAASLFSVTAAAPLAAQAVSSIHFAKGNDNASVKGSITGRQYRDYKLAVGAGQTLAASLITRGSAYFNILPPGSKDVAVYNSSVSGQDATGIKTRAGTYTIRVYSMGAAKTSKRPVSYQLSVTVM
jgi:hypothetical protein